MSKRHAEFWLAATVMVQAAGGCGGEEAKIDLPDPSAVNKGVDEAAAILKDINVQPKGGGTSITVLTLGGGRRLKVVTDKDSAAQTDDKRAEVRFGDRKVVIDTKGGRVLVGDSEKAKLPAGFREVEVRFVAGKLSATADGAPLIPETSF